MAKRDIDLTVAFDWDFDDTFSDESSRVLSVRVDRSLTAIGNPITGGSGRIQKASITLDNHDNRYSSKISTGISDIANGKIYFVPVRINIDTGTDYRIFTGICTIPLEYGETKNRDKNITITALSNEEKLRNSFFSLPVAKASEWLADLPTEDIVISYLLSLVSLSGTLDKGLFTVFSYLSSSSILSEIWNIAKSTGGYFFCDRDGDYIYKNATSFFNVTSLDTFTKSDFGSIEMKYDEVNLSRKVSINGSVPTGSDISSIYVHNENLMLAPSEVLELTLNFNNPVYEISSIDYNATTIGGSDLSGSLSFSGTYYIDSAYLSFTNNSSVNMVISGISLSGKEITEDNFSITKTSSDGFWTDRSSTTIETKIRDQYLSSFSSADTIASMILNRQQNPIPTFFITDLVYSGEIELLDKITIDDDTLDDNTFDIFVMGLSYTISKQSGVRLSVVGVDSDSLYPYQSTDPTYFIFGTNKLGTTDPDKARLFF